MRPTHCSREVFFFQAEDGIRDLVRSRGLGDVYKRQLLLDYLAAHDIRPGAPITFDEIAPFNGPLLVTVLSLIHI